MDSATKARLRYVRDVKKKGLDVLASTTEFEEFIRNLPMGVDTSKLDPKQADIVEGLVRWGRTFINTNFKKFIAEDPLVSAADKLRLLKQAREFDPELFGEIVYHLKDAWPYTKPSSLGKLADLYLSIILADFFESEYCFGLAINLFERLYFEHYTKAFAHIIESPASDSTHVIEACKYLLVQDDVKFHSLAQESFIALIEKPTELKLPPASDYESEFEDIDSDEGFSPLASVEEEDDFLDSDGTEDETPPLDLAPPKEKPSLEVRRAEWERTHLERVQKARQAAEDQAREAASRTKYNLIDSFLVRSRKKGPRGKPLFVNYIKPYYQSKHLRPSETINLLEFIAPVSLAFIQDVTNYIRHRIIAASNFLASGVFPQDEVRTQTKDFLEGLINDAALSEDVRADAIDVLLMNAGSNAEDSRIRKILLEIGLASASKSASGRVQDRIRTIYNNTQNAHDESVVASVLSFINQIEPDQLDLLEYQDIVRFLERPLADLSVESRHKANSALYRIKVDRSTVGERCYQVSEIFSIVWACIHDSKRTPEEVKTLEKRLVEELVDMGETCAGGHVNRLVGVLQGFGFEMKISFTAQIVSNYAGRMNARIEALPEAQREDVLTGISSKEEGPRGIYLKFAEKAFADVRGELHREFVGAKYVSEAEFKEATQEARKEWF